MKTLTIFFITLFLSFSFSLASANSDTGTITGTINYCSKGGVAGMQVFIPGKPYIVITGSDGRFQLSGVREGEYSLNFMLHGKVIHFNTWVEVSANKKTKLEKLKFCDTSIASGAAIATPIVKDEKNTPLPIVAEKVDCTKMEDGTIVIISNGTATCQGGNIVINSCNKGFASCDDKTISGCESDLMSDNENCGSCYNECTGIGICALGVCN